MGRPTLLRTTTIGVGVLQWGREIGLNPKYINEKWEFLAKEQSGGHLMEKLVKGNIRDKGVGFSG